MRHSKRGYASVFFKNSFENKEAIFDTYPTGLIERKDKYQSAYFERIPTREELLKHKNDLDFYVIKLLQENIPIHLFAKSEIKESSPCGSFGDLEYEEFIIFKDVWFSFCSIQNKSDMDIIFNYLRGEVPTKDFSFLPVGNKSQSFISNLELPKSRINKNQSVLIPIGIIFPPFNDDYIEEIEISLVPLEEKDDYSFISINSYKTEENQKKDFYFFSDFFFPKELNYSFDDVNFTELIRDFNPDKMYTIDQNWAVGSCPHLFYKEIDNEWSYVGELFSNNSGEIETEKFIIPFGVSKIKIVELEDEITYINSIKIDNVIIYNSIQLNKGESIEIAVEKDQLLVLEGKYSKLFENVAEKESFLFRRRLISGYLKNINHIKI